MVFAKNLIIYNKKCVLDIAGYYINNVITV